MSIYADTYMKTYNELDEQQKYEAVEMLVDSDRFEDYWRSWSEDMYDDMMKDIEERYEDFASVSGFNWNFSSQGPYLDMYRNPRYELTNVPDEITVNYNGKEYTVEINGIIEFSYDVDVDDIEVSIYTTDEDGDFIEYNNMYAFNTPKDEKIINAILSTQSVSSVLDNIVSKLQSFFDELWENVNKLCLYDYESIEDYARSYAEDEMVYFEMEFDEETEEETIVDFKFDWE